MKLNELKDRPGARKGAMRVGRGPGSGKGKTAGRGHKGAKARSGVAINGFEGGQMPIHMRLPKRGFNSLNKKQFELVNLGRLQSAIDAGRLDAGKPIGEDELRAAGLVGKVRDGIRLLAKGEIKAKLDISVTGASKAAVSAVEKAGGKVTLTRAAEADTSEKADKADKKGAKADQADTGKEASA